MNKLKTVVAFIFGTVIGGIGVWCYINEKYIKCYEQEILSIKESYHNHEKDLENKIKKFGKDKDKSLYIDPSLLSTCETKKGSQQTDNDTKKRSEETYVISPDEFGEMEGYAQVSLTYYADHILADENCVIIDDVEDILGDALDHFGEYENDSVFCRNDQKRCDYEILKDLRYYSEVRKSFPFNI